jgi:hypothetical protein
MDLTIVNSDQVDASAKSIADYTSAILELDKVLKDISSSLKELNESLSATVELTFSDTIEKWVVSLSEFSRRFKYTKEFLSTFDTVFESFGMTGHQAFEKVSKKAKAASSTIKNAFKSMKPSDKITAAIYAVQLAFTLAAKAFKFFSELGIRSAIDEERRFIEISEETEEKIVKLNKKLDDSHAAISMYMAEIVKNAKINKDNFEYYVYRTAEVIEDFKNKSLSLNEVKDSIGKTFPLLVKEAQKLGTEGSRAMVKLISEARAQGMKIPEMQDYVNKKLSEGLKALKTFVSTFDTSTLRTDLAKIGDQLSSQNITLFKRDRLLVQLKEKQKELAAASKDISENWEFMEATTLATFAGFQQEGKSYLETVKNMGTLLNDLGEEAEANGIKTSGAFQDILHISDFVKDNEKLVTRIESTNKMMVSLHDGVHLTKRAFDGFGDQAVKQFDALKDAGLKEEEALMLIAPQLNKLNEYASRYNVTLNDQIQSIIEKGRQEGLVATAQETTTRVMIDLLSEIARALGAKIPESAKKMSEATKKEFKNIADAGEELEFKIKFEDITKHIPEMLKNARKALMDDYDKEQSNRLFDPKKLLPDGIEKEIEEFNKKIVRGFMSDDYIKSKIEKVLPQFQGFIAELQRTGDNVNLSNMEENLNKIPDYIEPFKVFVKQQYKLDFDSDEAQHKLEFMFKTLGPIAEKLKQKHEMKTDFDQAKAGVISLMDTFEPMVSSIGKVFGIDIDVDAAKNAVESLHIPWNVFKESVETALGIKLDTSQIKTAISAVAKIFEPFSQMLKTIGMDFSVEEMLNKLVGLENAQERVNKKTKEAKDAQKGAAGATSGNADANKKLNSELDAIAEKYGLMKNAALDPTKELYAETEKVITVFEKYKSALDKNANNQEKNAVSADKLRAMLKDQLDLYDKYKIEVPQTLKDAAEKYKVLSTAQEAAKQSAESLLQTYGFLSDDGLKKLDMETEALITQIRTLSEAEGYNEEQKKRLTAALTQQLQKYPDLKNASKIVRDFSSEWLFAEKTLSEATDKQMELAKAMDTNPVVIRNLGKEVIDYAKKLNITGKELEKYSKTEWELAKNIKSNPGLIRDLGKEHMEYVNKLGLTGEEVSKYTIEEMKLASTHKIAPSLVKELGAKYVALALKVGVTVDELKDYNMEQVEAADNTKHSAKEVKKYSQEHRDLAAKLRMSATELDKAQKGVAAAQKIFSGARGIISDLGIEVSEGLGHALDAGEKGLDAFSKLLSGDFVGAAVAAVSALVSLGAALFSLFEGDGVGEAIDRERRLITITEEMEEKIRDLEETIGDTHAATSMLMDEIIKEANINANNFENYAKRMGEIVLDLDRGHINLKEFQESMGKSWNALLEEAQNLGMEGSFEMLSVIRNMRNRGLEVAEIQEYVNEQIMLGIEAFDGYLASFGNVGEITDKIAELQKQLAETAEGTEEYIDLTTKLQEQHDLLSETITDIGLNFESMKIYAIGFIDALIAEGATFMEIMDAMDNSLDVLAQIAKDNGLEVTGALKEMLDMREFISQNEEIVNRISFTIKMMESFGNTSYLSAELFNQFQTDAQSHFDALIAKTDDAKMAYQLIGPELGKLLWYSQQYGYELDENTKKLIAEADQHGVNMKAMIPPQEKMVALLEELVVVLGGKLPYAIDDFGQHGVRGFENIRGETVKWGRDLDDIETRLRNDLPDAANELDRSWENNVSGNTILAENEKWENSLLYIRDLMGKELPQTAEELDGKYGHVIGDINEYLNITSVEGYKARLTFEQMGAELEQLHTAYAALAAQGKLTDNEKDVLTDLERQINNLNQAMEDVIDSYTNMDQLIRDAEITAQNFGSYVEQTGTIIDAMNQGILTTQEAQEALGKSFNALLDEAQQLGMEGSSQMLKLMQDIKTSGLEVAEVQEYINDQLKAGTDAFGKYLGTFSAGPELKEKMVGILDQLKTAKGPERAKLLEDLAELKGEFAVWQADVSANFDSMGAYAVGMFSSMIEEGATFIEAMQAMGPQLSQLSEIAKLSGEEVSGPLKEMLDMQDFIDQNETLVTRISATTEMMESLGNTGYLTSELFNTFQNDAQTQFDALMTKTNDATQAYQLMGPELAKLAWYSQQYGYELDAGTKSMIAQAQQHGVNMKAMIPPEEKMVALMESLVTLLGGDIPYAMDQMKGKTEKAFKDMKGETGEWKKELDKVEDKLKEDLKNAVTNLDNTYTDAMTGHSIVTETKKWKHSLEDVEDILGRELLETADSLDEKYKHVMGNIYEYLQKTSKEGYMNRMSFGQMVDELERLKNAHDKLALKKKRSDKENNIMDDYKRQITELSEAIEETAPTLENFGKKFEEFQDQLSDNIGVNRGMIEIARGLREQGQSLEEIDSIIEKSLSDGSKGLGAWVQALGPAEKELEDLKKLQEDYNELMEKEEKKEEDLLKLEQMRADIEKGKTAAQQSMLHDQNALLDSQDLIVAYFHSLQAEGKGVSEIMEIMGDSFEALAGKSLEDITGQSGIAMSETFSQLYELQQKMGDNETLVKGIEGLGEALHGMGDSMLYMSDETFGSFEKSAVNAFQKLKESGFDQRQSLQLMAPLLHDLGSYAEEYGFSLSKSTRKMLEGAKEEGLIREKQKSDTEKLVEVNEHLALVMERMAGSLENLGKLSPFAAMADETDELEKKTAQMQAYQRQQKTIERKIRTAKQDITLLEDELKLTGYESPETRAGLEGQIGKKERDIRDMMKRQSWVMQLYDRTRLEVEELQAAFNSSLPPGGDYITAALGYHGILNKDRWFRLHEGERVDVWSPEETQRIMATPIKRMNLSDTRPSNRGGDIVFEHITIQSENGDEAVKEFMTAIKGNKYGVQNLIRKVAQ